jgi:hypothetical protein
MVSGRFLSSDWAKKHAFLWETSGGGGAGFARGGAPVPYGSLAVLEKKFGKFLEKRPWPTPSQIAALGEIRLSDVDRTLPGMCNASSCVKNTAIRALLSEPQIYAATATDYPSARLDKTVVGNLGRQLLITSRRGGVAIQRSR